MSLSSVCVVTNALRLNFCRIHSDNRDRKKKSRKKNEGGSDAVVEKTVVIEGMMCAHCERAVKEALEKLPGVISASADFTAGTAVVKLTAPLDYEVIKTAIEAEGYKVIEIK